jgi:hypothetical protein
MIREVTRKIYQVMSRENIAKLAKKYYQMENIEIADCPSDAQFNPIAFLSNIYYAMNGNFIEDVKALLPVCKMLMEPYTNALGKRIKEIKQIVREKGNLEGIAKKSLNSLESAADSLANNNEQVEEIRSFIAQGNARKACEFFKNKVL